MQQQKTKQKILCNDRRRNGSFGLETLHNLPRESYLTLCAYLIMQQDVNHTEMNVRRIDIFLFFINFLVFWKTRGQKFSKIMI